MIYSQTGSYAGYGFAIPTTIMNKVVDDLKKYGTVQRAVLGIAGTDVSNYIDMQKEKDQEVDLGTITGIYVNEVSDGSAAEEGGLQKGDVIIALDGKKIEKFSEMQEVLVNHNPGDKMTVTYLRDKKQHKVNVTLKNVQGTTSAVENIDSETMGAALRPLTDKEKQELNLRYGLVVSAVKNGKMKEQGITKGIILMKVNDKEMHSVADFEEAVKEANMSSERVLWIRAKTQSGINRSFTIELDTPKK
jgi:S1-C subfamily serine protease